MTRYTPPPTVFGVPEDPLERFALGIRQKQMHNRSANPEIIVLISDGDGVVVDANESARVLFDLPNDLSDGSYLLTRLPLLRRQQRGQESWSNFQAKLRRKQEFRELFFMPTAGRDAGHPLAHLVGATPLQADCSLIVNRFFRINLEVRTDDQQRIRDGKFQSVYIYRHGMECLSALQAAGHPVAVPFLDIDDFRSINKEIGHAKGDDILTELVSALTRNVRADDVITRHGGVAGDEYFVALDLGDCTPSAVRKVESMMRRVCSEFTARCALLGFVSRPVTVSCGIAYSTDCANANNSPESAAQLVNRASRLCSANKASAKLRHTPSLPAHTAQMSA